MAQSEPSDIAASATRYKDVLPFVAAAFAALYGAGWLIESILLSHLGLGSLDVQKEKAIAAGATFFIGPGLLPLCVLWGFVHKSYLATVWAVLSAVAINAIIVDFATGTKFVAVFDVEFLLPYFYQAVMTLAVALMTLRSMLSMKEGEGDPMFVLRLGGPFLVLLVSIGYGIFVAPELPASLGGLSASPVSLTLSSPSEAFDAYLVSVDDKGLVYAISSEQPRSTRRFSQIEDGAIHRVRWERVVDILKLTQHNALENPKQAPHSTLLRPGLNR